MSKFCGNCGAMLDDNAAVCTTCGAVLNQGTINSPDLPKKKKKSGKKKVAVAVIALMVAIAVGFGGVFVYNNTGYRGVIAKYVKALNNCDAKLYYSILSNRMKDEYEDFEDYHSNEGFEFDLQNSIETKYEREEDIVGKDFKYSHRINDIYKVPKKDTKGYFKYLDKEKGYDNISEFVIVDFTLIAKGKKRTKAYSYNFVLSKENGKWKIFESNGSYFLYDLEEYEDYDPDDYEDENNY